MGQFKNLGVRRRLSLTLSKGPMPPQARPCHLRPTGTKVSLVAGSYTGPMTTATSAASGGERPQPMDATAPDSNPARIGGATHSPETQRLLRIESSVPITNLSGSGIWFSLPIAVAHH